MFSVRARQIAGVTSLVGFIVLVLTLLQLNAVARISLEETGSRAGMLANAIYQSAFGALMAPGSAPAVESGDPEIDARLTLWDVHARYNKDRWDVRAQYAQGHLDDAREINAAIPGAEVAEKFYGWYTEAAYRVWEKNDQSLSPFIA